MRNVPPRSEAGQAVPLLAAVMAVAAVLILGLGQLGQRVAAAARARTAADAAALPRTGPPPVTAQAPGGILARLEPGDTVNRGFVTRQRRWDR
jgi:hypothetical protein